MDELELLRRGRSDPAPAEAVVDRHRAALWQAMLQPGSTAAATGPVNVEAAAPIALRRTSQTGRRRPLAGLAALGAAAAAVLAVVSGAAMVLLDDDDDGRLATAGPATSVAPLTGDRCGPLPVTLVAPPGFGPVTEGPGPDGSAAAPGGQLVAHWVSPTGSIEVRWPSASASAEALGRTVDRGTPAEESTTWSIGGQPRALPSGRHAVSLDVHDPRLSQEGPCQSIGFLVADADPERARAVGRALYDRLGEPGGPFGGPEVALVTGDATATAPPAVPACNAPPGVDHVDRVGGPVSLGSHPTAEAALAAFVESTMVEDTDPFGLPDRRATVIDRGYVATGLPDGSIAFVHEVGLGVTVVHAVRVGDAWTVDWWEATGC